MTANLNGGGGRLRQMLNRHFGDKRVHDVNESQKSTESDRSTTNNVSERAVDQHASTDLDKSSSVTVTSKKGVKFDLNDERVQVFEQKSLSNLDEQDESVEQDKECDHVHDEQKNEEQNDQSDREAKTEDISVRSTSDNESTGEEAEPDAANWVSLSDDLTVSRAIVPDAEHDSFTSNLVSGEQPEVVPSPPLTSDRSSSVNSSLTSSTKSDRSHTKMPQKSSTVRTNRVSPTTSKVSSIKSRSDSNRRRDTAAASDTTAPGLTTATIAEEEVVPPIVNSDVVPKATEEPIPPVKSATKAVPKKDAKDAVSKRKPSVVGHRNSKQETAMLLRRKSLTPSTKLIILCKKGTVLIDFSVFHLNRNHFSLQSDELRSNKKVIGWQWKLF